MSVERAEPVLTPYDVIGFGFCAMGLLFAAVAALRIQPAYVGMFAELGGELPMLTVTCLRPWFPFVFPLVGSAVVAMGLAGRTGASTRPLLMAAAILVQLAGVLIFVAGMYLPIFELAGSIK